MKLLIFLLTLVIIPSATSGQNCDIKRYRALMQEADTAFKNGKYDLAINKLQSAKTCQPDSDVVVNLRVVEVFQEVNRQRTLAINNEKTARRNLEKANRLIYHFNFNGEAAAWAYKNGKFAVINLNGDTLTGFIYDSPEPFQSGVAIARINNQYALIDEYGTEKPKRYSYIIKTEKGFFLAGGYDFQDFLNEKKDEILSFPVGFFFVDKYLDHEAAMGWVNNDRKFSLIQEDFKFGVVNASGELIVEPRYDFVKPYSFNLAAVKKEGKWGYIDTIGVEVIPLIYESAEPFYEKMAFVRKGGKWGLIDELGNQIVAPIYESVESFSEGLAAVYKNKRWGVINMDGIEVIPEKYEWIQQFSEGVSWVLEDHWYGCIDKNGKTIIPFKYRNVEPFKNGVAIVKNSNGEKILIDKFGNEKFVAENINRLGQERLIDLNEGIIRESDGRKFFSIGVNKKWGLIDTSGNIIVAIECDNPIVYDNGLIIISKNEKYGVIDELGKEVIPFSFDFISSFDYGKAIVKLDEKYGVINISGLLIIHPEYDYIEILSGGEILVREKNSWFLADEFGSQSVMNIYDYIEPFPTDGIAKASRGEKWSYIDKKGRLIGKIYLEGGRNLRDTTDCFCGKFVPVPEEVQKDTYIYVESVKNGLQIYGKNGKFGIIDSTGHQILNYIYDNIAHSGYRIYIIEQGSLMGLFAPDYGIHIEPAFEKIGYIDEEYGWIRVQQNGKWGWVDRNGVTKIPFRYDAVKPFKNGLALVMQKPYPKLFFINSKGEMVLNQNQLPR